MNTNNKQNLNNVLKLEKLEYNKKMLNKIVNKILNDFSLTNYNNLFKGEKIGGCQVWYLLDNKKKRIYDYCLTDEWIYALCYNPQINELSISALQSDKPSRSESYSDILDDESKKLVFARLLEIEEKYNNDIFLKIESDKKQFVSRIFGA